NGDTIQLNLLDGFSPSSNFFEADLLIAQSINGVESLLLEANFPPSFEYSLQTVLLTSGPFSGYEALRLQVGIVPEPSALGLLALGLPLILRRRRGRTSATH